MKFIEVTNQIKNGELKEVEYKILSEDDFTDFLSILGSSNSLLSAVNSTECVNELVEAFPSLKKIYDKNVLSDLFYAYKLGRYFKGVPNKLVYILDKCKREYGSEYVNSNIEKCRSLIEPYIKYSYVSDAGKLSVNDVIGEVFDSTNLLTDINFKVETVNGNYEIYIPEVDRVALLPKDIGGRMTFDDCKNLTYTDELGICMSDIPIRTLNNRLGITSDDFDLIKSF